MLSLINLVKIIIEQQKKKVIRKGKVYYQTKCDSDEKPEGDKCILLTAKEKEDKKNAAEKAKMNRKLKVGSVKSVKKVKSVDD